MSKGKAEREQREALRLEQRALERYIESHEEEISKVASKASDVVLSKLNAQLERVKNTREAGVDAQVFKTVSKLTTKQVYKIGEDDLSVSWSLFTENVKKSHDRDNEDQGLPFNFEALGLETSVFFNSCMPSVFSSKNFMLGPLKIKRKQRQPLGKRKAKPMYAEEKAVEVVNDDEKGTKKTKHNDLQEIIVSKIREQYLKSREETTHGTRKNVDEANLFRVLFNPQSFTQTVENLFEFSFLVNDGWSGIGCDSAGLPMIIPKDPSQLDTTSMKKTSSILSLTYKDFERIVKELDLKTSVIPHRDDEEYKESYLFTNRGDNLIQKDAHSSKEHSREENL